MINKGVFVLPSDVSIITDDDAVKVRLLEAGLYDKFQREIEKSLKKEKPFVVYRMQNGETLDFYCYWDVSAEGRFTKSDLGYAWVRIQNYKSLSDIVKVIESSIYGNFVGSIAMSE